jgi:GT2 family glycosyltransferase
VACGAVVRRDAFLAAGGFAPRFGVGGEEELLAVDLASAGWALRYAPQIVAHHHPAPGPRHGREVVQARNALWAAWLRRPLRIALARTRRAGPRAVLAAARELPWVLRDRRVVPGDVERDLRLLEAAPPPFDGGAAR